MDWDDDAVVLSSRPYGESSAVVVLMTRCHGRHSGLVRGGQSRRRAGELQAGNLVAARWRGRLAENLGTLSLEPVACTAGPVFHDPVRLAALASACAVTDWACPDREPHTAVFEGLCVLLKGLAETPFWGELYVRWELGVLAELGYGVDLSQCAATGSNDQLAYVSPRSGRAVSLSAGEPYRDRLLALPQFLIGRGTGGPSDVMQGLALTGFFLEHRLFATTHRALPPARRSFAHRYRLSFARAAEMT